MSQLAVSLCLFVLGVAVASGQPEEPCVQCCTPTSYIQLSFYLRLGGGDGCGDQDYLDHGVRLEKRGSGEPWSEIRFYSLTTETATPSSVTLENSENVFVQDIFNYSFPLRIIESTDPVFITESICGFDKNSIRFRWVQYPYRTSGENENTWSVDDIAVTYWDGSCERVLFQEDFEGTTTLNAQKGIVTIPPCGPTATGNASYFHGDITNGPNQRYLRRRTNTPSLSLPGSTECLPSPAEGCYANRSACMTLGVPSCSVDGCSCKDGYSNEELSCIDENECDLNTHNCSQVCTNTAGEFQCSCYYGYQLDEDKVTCTDIDECATGSHNCSQTCTNNEGGFECSCEQGLLDNDNTTCIQALKVGWSASAYTFTEGGVHEVCVRVFNGTLDRNITVLATTHDFTATASDDYTTISMEIVLTPAMSERCIPVVTSQDGKFEDTESFVLELSTVEDGVDIAPSHASVNIDDNGITVGFEHVMYTVQEDIGSMQVCGMVTMGTLESDVFVTLASTDGTAKGGVDYEHISSAGLTFTPTSSKVCTVARIIDDDVLEGVEQFTVTVVTGRRGVVLQPASATVTIIDNDLVNISLGQSEYSVAEGSGVVEVCVEAVSGELGREVMVTIATDNGTAVATRDYEPLSIELDVTDTPCTNVSIIDDIVLEVTESLFIFLSSNDPQVAVTLNSAAVHITDNDVATIGIEPGVVMAREEESMVEVGVAVLQGYLGTPITVTVISTDSTATSPMDYTAINSTLTLHPGTTRVPLIVAIRDDTVDEMAEIFFLSLSLQTPMEAVTLDPSTAMVSIVDNDVVTIGLTGTDYSVSEGAGSVEVCVGVAVGSLEREAVISLFTSNGTAIGFSDYLPVTMELIFSGTRTRSCLPIIILDDTEYEDMEIFTVTLSGPDSVLLIPGDAVITITNDDDFNECLSGVSNCSQLCNNTDGDYHCLCYHGYLLDGDGVTCNDVNECDLNTHNNCSQVCINTAGGFQCSCYHGYQLGKDRITCTDVDECLTEMSDCSQQCQNTEGGYQCACDHGYILEGDNITCTDVDECLTEVSDCSQQCQNTEGGYQCACDHGYILQGDNITCTDVDECLTEMSDCSQQCQNTEGGYQCACDHGYILEGDNITCTDVDECLTEMSDCSQQCQNTEGGYQCACDHGYILEGDNITCTDVDECLTEMSDCSQQCQNTEGGYQCACDHGYILEDDNITCTDVDECLTEMSDCSQQCQNTEGGYQCACDHGYILEDDNITCTALASDLNDLAEQLNSGSVGTDEAAYHLENLLNNVLESGEPASPELSQAFVGAVSAVFDPSANPSANLTEDEAAAAVSNLLGTLDTFALQAFDASSGEEEPETDNIKMAVQLTTPDDEGRDGVPGIMEEGSEIFLPSELLRNTGANEVRIASFYFRNLSGFLPDSSPEMNGTTLGSAVISSTLGCGSRPCGFINTTKPVRITLKHKYSQAGQRPLCVFWDLVEGVWSTKGCSVSSSSDDSTSCECHHLTHFAILLSPDSNVPEDDAYALQLIGYVGVSISLICLLLTVAAFLFLKSLRSNMRNYIHINLSISLMIAQLTFVTGVDKTKNEAACQTIAIFLHYFFLVTFMWMLMEGFVLYVALVRVFVKRQKLYMLGFTIFSYGVPALYLAVVVPLGLALDNGPHYGGDACWLRYDTHFIWAFIAPVIVTILVNSGFFIMAIYIMFKHEKKNLNKSQMQTAKHWLKACISLLVVMGITWIIGVLAFHEALLAVAYIFTIGVAFQGLFIFILFVPMSKQVREKYRKWWRGKVAESETLSKYFGAMAERPRSLTRLTSLRSSKFDRSTSEHVSTTIQSPKEKVPLEFPVSPQPGPIISGEEDTPDAVPAKDVETIYKTSSVLQTFATNAFSLSHFTIVFVDSSQQNGTTAAATEDPQIHAEKGKCPEYTETDSQENDAEGAGYSCSVEESDSTVELGAADSGSLVTKGEHSDESDHEECTAL